ncbi:S9 family peptidase [Waterburya agarophytonicola K14]|uniref:S9 family peptidase n=1 Tax=Waterburya agarophytonicola KI4 TaxID=2874699 RepID=A0A964BRS3_9CYAN|nr:S9 family peptidase [Waterburya agarophytonicola]MCC0177577.1 S9 family peptidase [Waterburya agarophytonicola KI4]
MKTSQVATFGSWKSPITSDLIVSKTIGIGGIAINNEDIYWLEKRPQEKGRSSIVACFGDKPKAMATRRGIKNITPPGLSVRTKVHEYGGGAYAVAQDTLYFSNYADGRIYQQVLDRQPQPLTNKIHQRYADIVVDSHRNRLICVCEDREQQDAEAKNILVTIDLITGKIQTLVEGDDFYSSPRLSRDGKQLAWLSWNHPHMPWDSTYLWVANLNDAGVIDRPKLVAGGEEESICEPKWSNDGRLYFSSDRTNWWNLYRRNINGSIEILHQMAAEFAYPHWVFGLSTYGFIGGDRLICTYSADGSWHLGMIDLTTKQLETIKTRYTNISDLQASESGFVVFVGGTPTETSAVVKLDLDNRKEQILKRTGDLTIDPGYLALPEAIAFPTADDLTAHGWYYPPTNQDYSAPTDELPPLIVKSHGGPTAAASVDLNLRVQYWTSRGFGYLDVNYGGSIGYGRQYRQRLDGKWGIVDVEDCVNGAKYLVDRVQVDGDRLVITGSSAGGYTTLAALTFRDTFKAGASYYGVSDLEILAKDTHKFESRYLDRLIGKYPEDKAIYQERSPIYHVQQLNCPVIFFQGLEDKVVPPNQAEMMFSSIKEKGLPAAYVAFEQEAHGFRIADNIKKALDSEFYFYSQIFGFEPAEAIEPIEIINLK